MADTPELAGPFAPREYLRIYHSHLDAAVQPLVDLLRVNPGLAEHVVALALVMGVHEEARAREERESLHRRLCYFAGYTSRTGTPGPGITE